jgi:hypothetical protein
VLTSFYIYTANVVIELLISVKKTDQHLNPLKHEERERDNVVGGCIERDYIWMGGPKEIRL